MTPRGVSPFRTPAFEQAVSSIKRTLSLAVLLTVLICTNPDTCRLQPIFQDADGPPRSEYEDALRARGCGAMHLSNYCSLRIAVRTSGKNTGRSLGRTGANAAAKAIVHHVHSALESCTRLSSTLIGGVCGLAWEVQLRFVVRTQHMWRQDGSGGTEPQGGHPESHMQHMISRDTPLAATVTCSQSSAHLLSCELRASFETATDTLSSTK